MADNNSLSIKDLLAGKYTPAPGNCYIADPEQAVRFVATLLGRGALTEENSFRKGVQQLFQHCQEISLPGGLDLYRRFLTIGEKLKVVQKASLLADKTIVGFGGKFSAGKSSFINAISGMEIALPEAQDATTSIPTYIIHSSQERLIANAVDGRSCELSRAAFEAMTHEFQRKYGINCAPFVDSIMVETPAYSLDKRIALLDTPGYTKPDDNVNSRVVVSDKVRAREQLRLADYLIWLIDMDNDPLTLNDIEFIDSLEIKSEILIVFNKADLKKESAHREILEKATEDIRNFMSTPVFDVAAYSSAEKREYTGNVIEKFFGKVAASGNRNHDIVQQFEECVGKMRQVLEETCDEYIGKSRDFWEIIRKTQTPEMLCSIAHLWKDQNMLNQKTSRFICDFEATSCGLKLILQKLLGKKGK